MTITLYDCATAPSPRRARILLAEKGIAHETEQVDLRSGEQLGEAYRSLNPQCTVPALRTDDGLLLTDNPAIAAWAEARFPEPPLLGRTPADKAEIASWQWRVEFEGLMPVAEALRNSVERFKDRALPGPRNYAQIPALVERGKARAAGFLEDLEAGLAGKTWLAGEFFSVADITAFVVVEFAGWVEIQPAAHQQNIARWRAAMAARSSASA
jgi:glutathione S-transferase